MKILFFCTAFNSLSQRVYLALAQHHHVTVEYALSEELMIEAADLVRPDLIVCPFLTRLVPARVHARYLTLIVHPGPPGDAGPSALDWLLMGDDGSEPDPTRLLRHAASAPTLSHHGRPYWAVTVLQAIPEFDRGPVWAFEQFAVDIDQPNITKSSLYRGPVTRAAVAAVLRAVDRITLAAKVARSNAFAATTATITAAAAAADTGKGVSALPTPPHSPLHEPLADKQGSPLFGQGSSRVAALTISPNLPVKPVFARMSVTTGEPFMGGATHHRPLLRAADRCFDPRIHSAVEISRRIRCADSQPGCLSRLFGPKLYLYGGIVEGGRQSAVATPGSIIATRDEAVCIATCDGKGIWITHVRRVKTKTDVSLWPKVPALKGLQELSVLSVGFRPAAATLLPPTSGSALSHRSSRHHHHHHHHPAGNRNSTSSSGSDYGIGSGEWSRATRSTFQDICIDFEPGSSTDGTVAYVFFDFYNGAMSTEQCRRLLRALQHVLAVAEHRTVEAVVLMGGSYFSNGIHLNVIEAAADPALESWHNINAIDDLVYSVLHDFPARGIRTVAAVRGNAAAGGVALATACDTVLAGEDVVLNPAYRAMGLHGSEFHSLTYHARTSHAGHGGGSSDASGGGHRVLRDMMPLSARAAAHLGLVDRVLPGWGARLDAAVKAEVKTHLLLPPSVSRSRSRGSKTLAVPHATGTSRNHHSIETDDDDEDDDDYDDFVAAVQVQSRSPGSNTRPLSQQSLSPPPLADWKRGLDLSSGGLARVRAEELAEMAKDFWSPRSQRYHRRRHDFVRKAVPVATPRRFASHRRHLDDGLVDEEDDDRFDSVEWFVMKEAAAAAAAAMTPPSSSSVPLSSMTPRTPHIPNLRRVPATVGRGGGESPLADLPRPWSSAGAYDGGGKMAAAPSSAGTVEEKSWAGHEAAAAPGKAKKSRGSLFCCYYDAD